MHPILANIGSIPVHTYGFLIASGFLLAVFVIRRLAVKARLDLERILDLTFWCLLVGFLGARILFIFTRLSIFLEEPLAMFKIWEGGLVFLGGLIAGCLFAVWYLRRFRLPFWKTLDVLAPGLVIAHAFGRLGCLAAGCCYGKPTGTWFGIRIESDLIDDSLRGVLLHPTQLYEAFSLLILFFGLLLIFKRKVFDGQVALTYLLAYPIIRSIIEVFRGDTLRGFIIDDVLSTSQFISLIVFAVASGILLMRLKQVQKSHHLPSQKRQIPSE